MDDFYDNPSPRLNGSMMSKAWLSIADMPLSVLFTVLLTPFAIALMTRLLSECSSEKINGKNERNVWRLPYFVPFFGHVFSLQVSCIPKY